MTGEGDELCKKTDDSVRHKLEMVNFESNFHDVIYLSLYDTLAFLHCLVPGVVSIGRLTAFYVIFVPMEYIPSKPPHWTYIIVLFLYLAKRLHFFGSRFYKTIDIYELKDVIKGIQMFLFTSKLIMQYFWYLFVKVPKQIKKFTNVPCCFE